MKKYLPIIAGACALAAIGLGVRSCVAGAKLKQAKADYLELKRITEASEAILSNRIDEKNKAIGVLNNTIVQLNVEKSAKDAEISRLRESLADAVANEPPTTPEIEAMPIVISLRAQIGWLNKLVASNLDIIANREQVIQAWTSKFNEQVDISEAWRTKYENERNLRENCEKLFKLSERSRKYGKTWTKIALGVAGAGIIYGLTK